MKKSEYPKKSGIWIRELVYSQTFEGEQKTYSACQVTIPAKLTGSRRKRKQCKTKEEAERFASAEYRGSKKQGKEYLKATEELDFGFPFNYYPALSAYSRNADLHHSRYVYDGNVDLIGETLIIYRTNRT